MCTRSFQLLDTPACSVRRKLTQDWQIYSLSTSIGECFKTRNLRDSYNTCEDPAYFRWGFLWICRTICLASCPVIRIFLLEQKQTWRATGLLVSIRVRTHETTPGLAALWLGTKKQRFCGTNQKPERLRPFGTGPVRLCPQGLLVSYFTFLRWNFLSPVTTFTRPH